MASIISRIHASAVRFGPTSAILLLSQGISAISLTLLPVLGLSVSDVYSVGIQAGVGPYNGFVMGVIYLIVIGRPTFNRWKAANISMIAFSMLLTTFSLMLAIDRSGEHALRPELTFSIIALFGLGSIALGVAGVIAVRQACLGRPWLLAAVTIAPNFGMGMTTATIHFLMPRSASVPILPALAWAIVACFVAVGYSAIPLPKLQRDLSGNGQEARRNKNLHIAGLVIGLVTSTILPIGFVTAASKLAAGAATVLFLANRIGAAIVGILINSVLMVSINWEDTPDKTKQFSTFLPVLSTAILLAALCWHLGGGIPLIGYIAVAIAWLCLTCTAPIILREANVRRLGSVIFFKGVVDFVISAAALAFFDGAPSITGYFSALMLSQCMTILICGGALGQHKLVAISIVNFVLAIWLLVRGW